MSHNVERMIFTGKKPWWYGHAIQGTAVGVNLGADAVTSAVAIKEAGLDWLAVKRRAGYLDPHTVDIDGNGVWRESEGDRFLVRSSDGSVLGRCTDQYEQFQNAEAFAFLDRLVEDGNLLYHTAGSLDGGRRVWILAQTPTRWEVKRHSGRSNTHCAFVNAMLDHGGAGANTLSLTDIRVECANTLAFADHRSAGSHLLFRVPHRGDVNAKYALAVQALQVLADEAPGRREVLQSLAQQAMDTDEFIDFATSVFLGLDGDAEEVEGLVEHYYETATPRSKTILENKVAKVANLFERGQGNEGDSAYDALNAFSEYFDHFDIGSITDQIERGKRAAKAVTSSWIGAGAERKALAYKRLRERLR